jgi:hypothetical membrane protein
MLLGLSMGASYAFFAALAALRFPHSYGPWHGNTLSQLGNSTLNPHGAGFYLTGCIIAGVLGMAFFVSVGPWKEGGTRQQSRMLWLVQALGIAGGFGLVMNAVFPETDYALHHFFAGAVFNALGAATLLAPIALWRRDRSSRPIAAFCLLAAVAVIVMFIFPGSHWVEWLPVTMFLIFPSLIAYLVHLRAAPRHAER